MILIGLRLDMGPNIVNIEVPRFDDAYDDAYMY